MFKKLVSAFLYLLLGTALSSAAIYEVPGDYPTIQGALSNSQDGDTVIVYPGVYYENIDFRGNDVVLCSRFIYDSSWQTVEETIIDGSHSTDSDSGSTVIFHSGETSFCKLSGFTIRGGFGTLVGLAYHGGGIFCTNNSSPTISYNVIKNNNSIAGGGCAFIDSSPHFYRNLVLGNSAFYGAGISLDNSMVVVDRSIFAYNNAADSAGAMNILLSNGLVIKNSVFYKNNLQTQSPYGGIACFFSFPVIKYNDFFGNVGGNVGDCYFEYGDTSCCLNFNLIPADTFDNIFRDPKFVSPQTGDFMIVPQSPLIDAGSELSPDFPQDGINIDIGIFEYSYLIGDANGDKVFDISDAYYLILFVFGDGKRPAPIWSADYNCDREVSISDVVAMLNRIFYNSAGACLLEG